VEEEPSVPDEVSAKSEAEKLFKKVLKDAVRFSFPFDRALFEIL